MASGGNLSRQSSNILENENDDKVESDFVDARDEPESTIQIPNSRCEIV